MFLPDHRLAEIRQRELLEEARRFRMVREALGGGARPRTWRHVSAFTGTVLIRIGEHLGGRSPRRSVWQPGRSGSGPEEYDNSLPQPRAEGC